MHQHLRPRRADLERRTRREAVSRRSDRFAARKRIVADLEALGLRREDRAAHASGAARRPLRRRIEPLADRPVVLQRRRAGQGRRSRRSRAARPCSCRSSGRTPSSPGCATSSPGASRASSGGAIRSRPGTGRTARCSSRRREEEAQAAARAHYGTTVALTPRRGRAGHLVQLGAVAVLDPGLAGADAGAGALLSRRRAGHRLRHHLLLGRPDDDDGPAISWARCRSAPSTSTRLVRDERGQKMSKSKGNIIDPLELIDELRRRRAALHPGGAGRAGPRHQARPKRASRAIATS